MKTFKAIVTDKITKEVIITTISQDTKKKAIRDLRNNGYKVNKFKVKTVEVFDYIMNETNCHICDWKENN